MLGARLLDERDDWHTIIKRNVLSLSCEAPSFFPSHAPIDEAARPTCGTFSYWHVSIPETACTTYDTWYYR